MNIKIKNFEKFVEISLIVFTIISLGIDLLVFAHSTYNCDAIYPITELSSIVTSTPFMILFWIDNCLIYLFALLYIISALDTKEAVLLKISFSIFSVLTTIIIANIFINAVAGFFGIV